MKSPAALLRLYVSPCQLRRRRPLPANQRRTSKLMTTTCAGAASLAGKLVQTWDWRFRCMSMPSCLTVISPWLRRVSLPLARRLVNGASTMRTCSNAASRTVRVPVPAHPCVQARQLQLAREDARARILLWGDYAYLGRKEAAVLQLHQAMAIRPHDSNIVYNAACTYGLIGEKEDALAMLKSAKEYGYTNWGWVSRDPDLACLHDDPGFRLLVEGVH